jgi:hypothetical protein
MKSQFFPFFGVLFALAFAPGLTSVQAAGETALDTATIETITGLKGVSNQAEGTFKVSKPRNDVAITVEQVRTAPFMGLTSWATFAPGMKDRVMVIGDMVLFEDEVNPVMSVALDKGLEVTALHNHFFFDEPKVYFTIGREVKMPCGCDVGASMGVNTWAAFAGTPDDALVVGDFAVLEGELQTVLKTLRGADINIVAIHQHMTGENPRMIFLHY